MSPISVHGDVNQSPSGGSTLVQQAPTAPSMLQTPSVRQPNGKRSSGLAVQVRPSFANSNSSSIGDNANRLGHSGAPTGPHDIASIRELQARKARNRQTNPATYGMKLGGKVSATNISDSPLEDVAQPHSSAKLVALQIDVNQLKSERAKFKDIDNLKGRCADIEGRINKLPAVQDDIHQLHEWRTSTQLQIAQVQELKSELAKVKTSVNAVEQETTTLREQIKKLQGQIAPSRLRELTQAEIKKAIEETVRPMLDQSLKQKQERYTKELHSVPETAVEAQLNKLSKSISALPDATKYDQLQALVTINHRNLSHMINVVEEKLLNKINDVEGALLNKINAVEGELSDKIKATEQISLDKNTAINEDLSSRITTVRNTLSSKINVVDKDCSTQIGSVRENLKDCLNDVDSVKHDLKDSSDKIGSVRDDLSKDIKAVDQNERKTYDKTERIESKMNALDDRLDSLHRMVKDSKDMKANPSDIKVGLEDTKNSLSRLSARVGTLEDTPTQATEAAKKYLRENADLSSRVKTLEQTTHAIKAAQPLALERMETLDRHVKTIQKKVLTKATEAAEKASRGIIDLSGRAETLEDRTHAIESAQPLALKSMNNLIRRVGILEQVPSQATVADQEQQSTQSTGDLNNRITLLEERGHTTEEQVSAIAKDVGMLDAGLYKVETDVAAIQNDVKVLKDEVPIFMTNTITEKIGSLRTKTEQKINGVEEIFSNKINQLEQRPLQAPLTIENPLLSSLNSKVTKVREQLDVDRQNVQLMSSNFGQQIANLLMTSQATNNQLEINRLAHNSLEERYQSISTYGLHQQMVHWFQQNYGDAPTLFQNIAKVQADLEQLRAAVHRSDSRVNDSTTEAEKISSIVDRLGGAYVTWSALEEFRKGFDNALFDKVAKFDAKYDTAEDQIKQVVELHDKLDERVTNIEGNVSKAGEVLDMKDDVVMTNQMVPYLMANQAKFMTIIKAVNANADRPLDGLDFPMDDSVT
jgi:chromosome segregation ATPase